MHIFRSFYCYQDGVYWPLLGASWLKWPVDWKVPQLVTGITTASATRPHVHEQNDLAISSRINDFNVQISAYTLTVQWWLDKSISLIWVMLFFYDFMIIILKNNLWSFKQERSKQW